MGSRTGHKYRHSFSSNDELISSYNREPLFLHNGSLRPFKGFAFEIRTKFILKTTRIDDHDETMNSEKFVSLVPVFPTFEDEDDEDYLVSSLYLDINARLSDYWMNEREIDHLVRKAIDYAKTTVSDYPRYAVFPVVIGLDVLTVRKEGETEEEARDRAISTEKLNPLALCPVGPALTRSTEDRAIDLSTVRVGVENIDKWLSQMNKCPICLHAPTMGDRISSLHDRHYFHNHCVVKWLRKSNLCPLCRKEIVVKYI